MSAHTCGAEKSHHKWSLETHVEKHVNARWKQTHLELSTCDWSGHSSTVNGHYTVKNGFKTIILKEKNDIVLL